MSSLAWYELGQANGFNPAIKFPKFNNEHYLRGFNIGSREYAEMHMEQLAQRLVQLKAETEAAKIAAKRQPLKVATQPASSRKVGKR